MAELYGENWMTIIAVSFVITWGVGLTPPLLIRFALKRSPISRWLSFFLCLILFMINVIFFTWLGSESKTHGALALVAVVSFFILTYKRKTKSDIEKEKIGNAIKSTELKERKEKNESDWSNL